MDFNAFSAGIEPGGLRNKDEIRLLICYVLESVDKPMSLNSMIRILQETGLANYFEGVEAWGSLEKNKNIAPTPEDPSLFTVTASGRMIATQLENELPSSVRDKAVGAALMLFHRQRAEKENAVHIKKLENGYNVSCHISGGDMDLFHFDLYVPDSAQARVVKRNFHKNPDRIYNIMIAVLTKNTDLAKTALEELTGRKS